VQTLKNVGRVPLLLCAFLTAAVILQIEKLYVGGVIKKKR